MSQPFSINVRKGREKGPEFQYSVGALSSVESSRCCAYNQTSERFLSADVEVADFSTAQLESRLASLRPGSGAALWIIPFRGISATLVRVPVDLLYLDQDCVVLAAIESFPLSLLPPSGKPAASVLALPAHTIASAGTSSGDQLILCGPAEMTRRLQQISDQQGPSLTEAGVPVTEQILGRTPGNVLPWVSRRGANDSSENPRAEVTAGASHPSPEPAPAPPVVEPEQHSIKPKKNWLQRLFSPDPPEPRKEARGALSGLVAYFFTGDTPAAHGVRDISLTGLYVFTKERWYLGTIVRMTLSDVLRHAPDWSLTVNARVVRWGNDGVGLQFVLRDKKEKRRDQASEFEDPAAKVTKVDLEKFIQRFQKDTV